MTKGDIAALNSRWKPFKAALLELIAMAKSAATRVRAAIKRVKETAAKEKKKAVAKQGIK